MSKESGEHLSYLSWGIVCVASVICIVALNSFNLFEWQGVSNEYFNLEDRLHNPNDKYHVVFVGNSLIRHAIEYDAVFEGRKELEGDVKISRLTFPGFHPEVFLDALIKVNEVKPDVVFLQSEIFYSNYHKEDWLYNYRENIAFLRAKVGSNHHALQNFPTGNNEGVVCSLVLDDEASLKHEFNKRNFSFDFNDSINAYSDFLDQAHKNGTNVIFLEMGRRNLINLWLSNKEREAIDISINRLIKETGREVWRFPNHLFDGDGFCDQAHLNEKGRSIFMDWIVSNIRKLKGAT